MVATPILFLILSILTPKVPEDGELQLSTFYTLTCVAVFVQILAGVGLIAQGLVDAAEDLPMLLAVAVTGMVSGLADKIQHLVKLSHGPLTQEKTVHLATHAIVKVVEPKVILAASFLDVKDLLPGFLFNIRQCYPVIGFAFLVLYLMELSPILVNVVPLHLGIISTLTFLILVLIFVLALISKKLTYALVKLTEIMANVTFGTILCRMLPAELIDHKAAEIIKLLDTSALDEDAGMGQALLSVEALQLNTKDMKMQLIELLKLDFKFEDSVRS